MGKISIAFDHIKDKTKAQELSVVLYADSFFYGIWDENNCLIFSDSASIGSLKDIMDKMVTDYDLKICRVMSTSKPYVHIASEDYSSTDHEAYLKGLYPLRKIESKTSMVDNFLKEEIQTLHYLDKDINELLKRKDILIKKSHISTAMANYAFLIDSDLITYVSDDTLHVSYTRDEQFQFYNQFDCYHKEDYLYFLLLSLKGMNLDPTEEEIHLGGSFDKASPLFTLLKSYLANIDVRDQNLKSEAVYPKHYYFDLYLCKSCV